MFLKFADWLVYGLMGLDSSTSFGEALHFFVYDVLKILFLLFTIITVIAYLRSYIDNNKLKRFIEKQPRLLAHLSASIFGAITPFCSCSSIPIFIGFIEAGMPFGVAMSFIITSPMINEIAILVLAGVIGWKITTIYIVTGIAVGTFGGMVMERFGWGVFLQDYLSRIQASSTCCCCQCTEPKEPTIQQRLSDGIQYSKDLMSKIWLFVLLGVGVGAFLHGYVPQEFFIKYLGGNNLFAVPLAVLAGIPLYADATTIIPIAQVFLDKGSAVGTVLVFMMSIVALSLPEMIIISRVMKRELIIRFVLFMFIVFTLVGYLYNLIL